MIRPDYDENLFPHWLKIPIRFRDLDPLNHVNNAIFSTFYEEARIAFIQKVPSLAKQLDKGFSFVIANIEIDFIRPIEYPAEILVGTGIKRLGNSSITSFQAIYTNKAKRLVSVAEASGVWFDLSERQPAKIPDFNKDALLLSKEIFNN